jgi:hypothetical protein
VAAHDEAQMLAVFRKARAAVRNGTAEEAVCKAVRAHDEFVETERLNKAAEEALKPFVKQMKAEMLRACNDARASFINSAIIPLHAKRAQPSLQSVGVHFSTKRKPVERKQCKKQALVRKVATAMGWKPTRILD